MTPRLIPARPFLKWAGGKTQLLEPFSLLYPPASEVRTYIEPFIGSGAVFFHVRRTLGPSRVILADGNDRLIEVYLAVRDQVELVIRHLARHRRLHSPDYYYLVRGRKPGASNASRAARLIYLNKTCFNGLYRENSRGEFNVPLGRYSNPTILDADNLRAASRALQGADLRVAHFGKTASVARKGDFIYFDPPYHPLSRTSSFTSYTRGSFRPEEQRALASLALKLHDRGCRVMLSNSDTPFIRELYDHPPFDLRTVPARRSINSKGGQRGPVNELVILNYVPSSGMA